MTNEDREARLARQLRENLKRRKARAREMSDRGDDPDRRHERTAPIAPARERDASARETIEPARGKPATEDDELPKAPRKT